MPGFFTYTSNRLEVLADVLAELVREPRLSLFDPEIIVVQSRGMERWVSMQLAKRLGVWANGQYPFPNALVANLFQKTLADLPASSPYDPQILAWKIMRRLESLPSDSAYGQLRSYIDGKSRIKCFQLACRIADQFDQYTVFRPDIIASWDRGEDTHWQALLWRSLLEENGPQHRASLFQAFVHALKNPANSANLPERITIFGISALPPYHVDVFSAIANRVDIHLLLLNPCAEFWDDIITERQAQRLLAKKKKKRSSQATQDLHYEQGNDLLAAFGAYGRDFLARLHGFDIQERSWPLEPERSNLLASLQSDILHLRNRAEDGCAPVDSADRSIQIHACHGPMREVEVLHDNLLSFFDRDAELVPSDIIVMTPDIETYAPYIEAVFGAPGDSNVRIPYSLADRGLKESSPLIDTFLELLSLPGSRYGAGKILSILENPGVQQAFGIDQNELIPIQTWVRESGIRWGIDASTRSRFKLPPMDQNTWLSGLDRLILGYALPAFDKQHFAGIVGYDHIEGSLAQTLGTFAGFIKTLFETTQPLEISHTPAEWSSILTSMLDRFFCVGQDEQRELKTVRNHLLSLSEFAAAGGYDTKIDLEIVLAFLKGRLDDRGAAPGFITGGVTFCAMMPMRSIPFKIVCLIGMHDGAFPRQKPSPAWDLIAANPRRGDRSLALEDRYMFLEAIISARETLYVSYEGQSARDNTPKQPSILVTELLEYLKRNYAPKSEDAVLESEVIGDAIGVEKQGIGSNMEVLSGSAGAAAVAQHEMTISAGDITKQLITNHRLQGFSADYYRSATGLFSYSRENCLAAQTRSGTTSRQAPFFNAPLENPPAPEFLNVSVGDLCSFFNNPCKFLIKKRLCMQIESRVTVIDDKEPFAIAGLDGYGVTQQMLAHFVEQESPELCYEILKATGKIPHGAVGQFAFQKVADGITKFAESLIPHCSAAKLEPVSIDIDIGNLHLHGKIDNVWQAAHIRYRYADLKPKDRMSAWINHVALNAANLSGGPRTSMIFAKDTVLRFLPVDAPLDLLGSLLDMYYQGLHEPLLFFPESSWEYAHVVLERGKDRNAGIAAAWNIWVGTDFNEYTKGECEDPHYSLCFNNLDEFSEKFCEVAELVFGPMIAHEDAGAGS